MASAIFPTRHIRVNPPKQASVLGAFATGVFALVLIGLVGWWQGPDLLKDYRISNNVEPATGARLASAKCRSKLVFHTCEAQIMHSVDNAAMRTSQNFAFVDLKFGSYTTTILQEKANPAVVTTSLALETLWNRIFTICGFMVLIAAGAFGAFKTFLSARRENDRFAGLDNTQLTPMLVDVYGYDDENSKQTTWYYGLPGTDPEKALSVIYDPKRVPFFLNDEGTKGLAVTSPTAKQPLLMDFALTYLKLEDSERNALISWRQSLLERQAAKVRMESQNLPLVDEQEPIRTQAA